MFSVLIRPCGHFPSRIGVRPEHIAETAFVPRGRSLRLRWFRIAGKRVSSRWQRARGSELDEPVVAQPVTELPKANFTVLNRIWLIGSRAYLAVTGGGATVGIAQLMTGNN